MATATALKPAQFSPLPVDVRALCASDMLQFDLYLGAGPPGKFTLYRRRSYPLTQADLNDLQGREIGTLYIGVEDSQSYLDYVREQVLRDQRIPPVRRYDALRTAIQASLSKALAGGVLSGAVQITNEVSQQIVGTICRSPCLLSDLVQVMSHDLGDFNHAINVATYCLIIAQRLGISDEAELVRIGQGALLHNIGARFIPNKLLQKQSRLSEREIEVIKEHPVRGFKELCRRDDLTWGQLMMVYQHHERCDGRGYPCGVLRAEIHEYGRICAIADVTAALMQDRPHRKAALKSDVISYFDREAGAGFDEEISRCWMATIAEQS